MAWCGFVQRRYVVSLLSFFGLCLLFGLRSALSVSLTNLVQSHASGNDSHHHTPHSDNHSFHLDWTTSEVGWVFSAYGIGYIITQIPGGVLSAALPAHLVFSFACAFSFGLFACLPSAIKAEDYRYAVVIRFLQGFVEGVTIPAQQGIWTEWAPESEKNKLSLIALSGAYCGPAIAMLVTGVVNVKLGWYWIFYIYSIIGGVWFIIWLLLVFQSPYKSPNRIGDKERLLFEEEKRKRTANIMKTQTSKSIKGLAKVKGIPWKSILTSLPVWAVFVAGTTRSWVLLLVTNYFSEYLDNVFHMPIDVIGYLSAVPFFVTTVTVCVGAAIADFVLKRKVVSRTVARKLFNCVGFGFEATILIVAGFMTSYFPNEILAVVLLSVSCGSSGFAASGYQANPLDLARDHAAILMGISKLGGIGGMIMPNVVGVLTVNRDPAGWSNVFWLTAGIELGGVLFFAIFASGKQQPWSSYRDARELDITRKNTTSYGATRSRSVRFSEKTGGSGYPGYDEINDEDDEYDDGIFDDDPLRESYYDSMAPY
ncbi:vesicular glutamate transporter 2-like [Lingula anatina]|uniref:Vesicular glutamate transporter 2-like n=1 Tax=Lingula anatina TaxID=7574 RepID=A0A1S3J0Z8_LINAN|nr:vesicular glutamate transporter 2-like [Lingula anatina]|eukprot:XP_013404117.1 vesicular glutamate transporter 2-like [Lingula anatina]